MFNYVETPVFWWTLREEGQALSSQIWPLLLAKPLGKPLGVDTNR